MTEKTSRRRSRATVNGDLNARARSRDWDGEWIVARKRGGLPNLLSDLRHASRTDAGAMAYLAMLYRDGVLGENKVRLLPKNQRRSRLLAQRAAALGNEGALLEVAHELDATRAPASIHEARRIYRRLADRGDVTAMLSLGVSYLRSQRHGVAVRWIRKAASAGDFSAEVMMAEAMYFGIGVPRQTHLAVGKLLALAGTERIEMSPFEREQCFILVARAFLDGWLMPRDCDRACGYLRTAAGLGSKTAEGMLRDLNQY